MKTWVQVVWIFVVAGCATIPKEAVELSYLVGQDLHELHRSHRQLAHSHFQNLRNQANELMDQRWKPAFLRDFIVTGELIEKAKGGDPNEVLEDVELWSEAAIEEIERKRKDLISPIDEDERNLLDLIDESFFRIIRANATITAHLNSLRKVEDVQNELLQSVNLKSLRDDISKFLVESSEKASKAADQLKKTTEELQRRKKGSEND